jgi:hypothetical protein
MSFDRQTIHDSLAKHLANMARIARAIKAPGLLEYARERAKELEADKSGLFVGLADAVRAELDKDKQAKQ